MLPCTMRHFLCTSRFGYGFGIRVCSDKMVHNMPDHFPTFLMSHRSPMYQSILDQFIYIDVTFVRYT
jgi:hypothetical protein